MPLDLDPIKARLAAASQGPWRWVRAYEHRGVHWCLENDRSAALGSTINHNLVTLSTDEYEYGDEGKPTSLSETPDFQLIAHAPTDLAALILEVERLRAAILATNTAPNPAAKNAAGLGAVQGEALVTLPLLIQKIESRGWLWEGGHCEHRDARGRFYARVYLPNLDSIHYDEAADERYDYGDTPEEATRRAFEQVPPDPYKK